MGYFAACDASDLVVFDDSTWVAETLDAGLPLDNHVAVGFTENNDFLVTGRTTSPFSTRLDTATWTQQSISAPSSVIRAWDSSPNGNWMAAASDLGRLHIYETAGWTIEETLITGLTGTTTDVSFNNDSSLVCMVSTGNPDSIIIYDTATWTPIAGPPAQAALQGCDFSPDGSLLAVVGLAVLPTLEIYETTTWTLIAGGPVHNAFSRACRFSNDGTRLALPSSNAPYLFVYDTSTWARVSEPSDSPSGIDTDVKWSEDDSQISRGANDANSARIWTVNGWVINNAISVGTYRNMDFTNPTGVVPPAPSDNPLFHGTNF